MNCGQRAGIEVRARGVLDARVIGHGGGFAATSDLDALGRRDRVHVVEVKRQRGDVIGAEGFALRKAGKGIDAGDARQLYSGFDDARDALGREVTGGGAAVRLPAPSANRTRKPSAREPDSVSCSTWPRRT